MIARKSHQKAVLDLLADFPVVTIVGSRQTGKTTLAAAIAKKFNGQVHRFDLEDPRSEARLAELLPLASAHRCQT